MPPKASASKAKASSDHASYQDMITDAIITLKDRKGSSRSALKKYVKANNKITATDSMFDSLFNRALKAGVDKKIFEQPKGSSGGTKLAKKEPKPAVAKKETAAKPKVEKKAEKKVEKKTEKKPVAKKVTKKPASTTKAKVAASKPKAPKKEAATKPKAAPKAKAAPKPKKAAPAKTAAVVDKPAVLGKTKSGRVTKTTPKTPAAKKATPKKAAPKKKATPKKAAASA